MRPRVSFPVVKEESNKPKRSNYEGKEGSSPPGKKSKTTRELVLPHGVQSPYLQSQQTTRAYWDISEPLEGPGMPVWISTPTDQQSDSTTGGEYEGEVEDERKYCFCYRVSFGEMIRCNDPNCEREWVRGLSNFLPKLLILMI